MNGNDADLDTICGRVWIIYVGEDIPLCELLANAIERAGFEPAFDKKSIPQDQHTSLSPRHRDALTSTQLRHELRRSNRVLVIRSPSFEKSAWANPELAAARRWHAPASIIQLIAAKATAKGHHVPLLRYDAHADHWVLEASKNASADMSLPSGLVEWIQSAPAFRRIDDPRSWFQPEQPQVEPDWESADRVLVTEVLRDRENYVRGRALRQQLRHALSPRSPFQPCDPDLTDLSESEIRQRYDEVVARTLDEMQRQGSPRSARRVADLRELGGDNETLSYIDNVVVATNILDHVEVSDHASKDRSHSTDGHGGDSAAELSPPPGIPIGRVDPSKVITVEQALQQFRTKVPPWEQVHAISGANASLPERGITIPIPVDLGIAQLYLARHNIVPGVSEAGPVIAAAEGGHPGAQLLLGLMYLDGHLVPNDDGRALVWLKLAAAHGSLAAQRLFSRNDGDEATGG